MQLHSQKHTLQALQAFREIFKLNVRAKRELSLETVYLTYWHAMMMMITTRVIMTLYTAASYVMIFHIVENNESVGRERTDTSTLMRMRVWAIIFESHSCIICVISRVKLLRLYYGLLIIFSLLLGCEWVWMINKQWRFCSKNVISTSLHSRSQFLAFFFIHFSRLSSHLPQKYFFFSRINLCA